VWAYLIQLLEGLQYLHAAGVAHAGKQQSGESRCSDCCCLLDHLITEWRVEMLWTGFSLADVKPANIVVLENGSVRLWALEQLANRNYPEVVSIQ
jgi:serine/threonine protein kinase